jgi:hypothetical protein
MNTAVPSEAQPGLSKASARLAGALYLATIGFGIFAEAGVRAEIRTVAPESTALNIASHEAWYRLGEAADLLMLCCYIAVTSLFYRLFAPVDRTLSLAAASFSLVGIAVLAVAGVFHLMPLALMDYSGTFQMDFLTDLALKMHADLYGISLVFFGVYCALIGILCFRTRRCPRIVASLMLIGGLVHFTGRLLWIAAPDLRQDLPDAINVLPLAGEAALAIWLLLFAMSPSTSHDPDQPFHKRNHYAKLGRKRNDSFRLGDRVS